MKSPRIINQTIGAHTTQFQDSTSKLTENNTSLEDLFDNLNILEKTETFNKGEIFEFVGDSNESTEISFILSNLSFNPNKNINKTKSNESDKNFSNKEILNILKLKKQPNTFSFPYRPKISSLVNESDKIISFTQGTKKISMAGRVLKGTNDTKSDSSRIQENDLVFSFIPERLSNPVMRNCNFNDSNQFTSDIMIN